AVALDDHRPDVAAVEAQDLVGRLFRTCDVAQQVAAMGEQQPYLDVRPPACGQLLEAAPGFGGVAGAPRLGAGARDIFRLGDAELHEILNRPWPADRGTVPPGRSAVQPVDIAEARVRDGPTIERGDVASRAIWPGSTAGNGDAGPITITFSFSESHPGPEPEVAAADAVEIGDGAAGRRRRERILGIE